MARDLAKNAPPDPIPNSEVKVFGADDTLYGESRFCGPFLLNAKLKILNSKRPPV